MARHPSHRPHHPYHPLNLLEKLLLLLFSSLVTSRLQENQLWAPLMRSSTTITSSSLWAVPEKFLRACHAIASTNTVSRIFIVNREFFMSSMVLGYGSWLSCHALALPHVHSLSYVSPTGVDSTDNACGPYSDCINRLTQVECLAEDCRCRSYCQNQR